MKLIIGDYNYSSWSMRPWMFVKYHDLDVEVERLLFESDALKEQMSKGFSNNKVPVLFDGDLEIWDTISILEYLSEKFPETQGLPANSDARAIARSICAEMHSSFQGLRNDVPMNCRRFFPGYQMGEQAQNDLKRIQQLWNHCRSNYGQEGPWLFGKFSIADAMYAPVVMRFRSVSVDLDPVSQAYCDTMNGSSAVQTWLDNARQEDHVFDVDEIDWPSRLLWE